MRNAFDSMDIDATIVVGEGERDEAPMLDIGEKVGNGKGPKIDIACDPLEGTTIAATRWSRGSCRKCSCKRHGNSPSRSRYIYEKISCWSWRVGAY